MDAGFRWIFSGFFALIPAIFFAVGLADALDQVRRFANPASTQGAIVAPDEGRVYEAGVTPPSPRPFDPEDTLIRFRYTVDGTTRYQEQSLFFQLAHSSIPRYALGQAVPVYYNAKNPDSAWLIAEIDSMSFMLMLFITPFWTIAAGIFFLSSPSKPASPATPVGNGWYQLPVRTTRSDKLFNAWMLLIVTSIPGSAIYLHSRIAPPWASFEMGFATALYTLFLGAMLANVIYRVATLRAGREAVVLINAPFATTGQPLAIRVEHDLRRVVPEGTLEVGLHCRRDDKNSGGGKTQYSTSTPHESWQLSRDVTNLAMGQPAVCEGDLELPGDARASRVAGDNYYPRYCWSVRVRTRLPGADYNANFALQVVAGSMPLPRAHAASTAASAQDAAYTPDEAHNLGLEHDTHRIVDDAPDHYNAEEAYGEADKAADAADDDAYDIDRDIDRDIDQDPSSGPDGRPR